MKNTLYNDLIMNIQSNYAKLGELTHEKLSIQERIEEIEDKAQLIRDAITTLEFTLSTIGRGDLEDLDNEKSDDNLDNN